MEEPPRPVVRLVGATATEPPPQRPPVQRRRPAVLAAGVALAVLLALVVHARSAPGWTAGPASLQGDSTVAVTVDVRSGPLRVTAVRLTGNALTVTAPGALDDEVRAAQERGVPPAHDVDRELGRGRHTVLLGVRPACGPASATAAVVVEGAQDGRRRRAVSPLPAAQVRRLPCAPLTFRAGVSPVPQTAGHLQLLVTAHVASSARPQSLRSMDWPGYQVGGVGAVVPQALGRAGIDETVFFDVTVAPDCSVRTPGALAAVFDEGVRVPVPLDDVSARRATALRGACG